METPTLDQMQQEYRRLKARSALLDRALRLLNASPWEKKHRGLGRAKGWDRYQRCRHCRIERGDVDDHYPSCEWLAVRREGRELSTATAPLSPAPPSTVNAA